MQEHKYIEKLELVKSKASQLAIADDSKQKLAEGIYSLSENLLSKTFGKDNYSKTKLEDGIIFHKRKGFNTPSNDDKKGKIVSLLLQELKELLEEDSKGIKFIRRIFKNNGEEILIDKTTISKVVSVIKKISSLI